MKVQSVFADARHIWHRQYLQSLAEYREQYQPSAPEVMFQLSDNGQPNVFRLYRADMASGAVDPPNITDVNLAALADTGAQVIPLPSRLVVHLHPIRWNCVDFLVDQMLADSGELQQWCSKWLDIDETGPLDEHGLLGAIHSVTAPEPQENGVSFSVDFGSAPVDAVNELLSVLRRLGATVVRISSSWAYET